MKTTEDKTAAGVIVGIVIVLLAFAVEVTSAVDGRNYLNTSMILTLIVVALLILRACKNKT